MFRLGGLLGFVFAALAWNIVLWLTSGDPFELMVLMLLFLYFPTFGIITLLLIGAADLIATELKPHPLLYVPLFGAFTIVLIALGLLYLTTTVAPDEPKTIIGQFEKLKPMFLAPTVAAWFAYGFGAMIARQK